MPAQGELKRYLSFTIPTQTIDKVMKKTLFALVALSGLAMAVELHTVTLNPLTDAASSWTLNHENSSKAANPTLNDGVIEYSSGNWSRGYAAYALAQPMTLDAPAHAITVTFTITTTNTDCTDVLTLISDDTALTLGGGHYNNNIQFGHSSTTTGTFYNFKDAATETGRVLSESDGVQIGAWTAGTPVTLKTTIAWDDVKSCFVATASNGATVIGTYDLGETYTLKALNISVDGDSNQKLSALSVAYTTPEPATATLSLLALAGLAARRKRR